MCKYNIMYVLTNTGRAVFSDTGCRNVREMHDCVMNMNGLIYIAVISLPAVNVQWYIS
jgi:hypothetical protein